MICPICSLYFQDVEQEAFRHHALLSHHSAAMMQALTEPKVKERFADLGLEIASREQQTPEGLAAFQKAEIDKWWPIIKAANIKGD